MELFSYGLISKLNKNSTIMHGGKLIISLLLMLGPQ
jgi:hypothetical protein